jgi:hypothetical protein
VSITTRRPKLAAILIVIVLFVVGLIFGNSFIPSASAITCTINVVNTNDSGSGSLRQAIIDANSAPNTDVICFGIGSGHQQIIPTSPMPPITQPVIIDGTTQPGYGSVPLIELSGNGAGSNAFGLRITGNGAGSTIRGLIINRFSSNGLFLDSGNNTIVGNYIGTTADGNTTAGNAGDGIGIFSGTSLANASGNTIGGVNPADRNTISGNGQNNPSGANGITINAQNGGVANNNTIFGNNIGTNAGGTAVVANTADGILVNDAGNGTITGTIIGGSSGTTPGGNCTGACNLISGNTANGIGLWHRGVTGTNVYGNYVGTNYAGSGGLGNGNIGLEINETPNNTAGGTAPANRNILSGNGGAGVFLTGASSTGNVVQGNYIGTNAAGTGGVGNVKMGIGVGASPGAVGANSNTIGGTTGTTPGSGCNGACNLISGNGQNGIFITGGESSGQRILGNYIGLSTNGTVAIGNVSDGIGILSTPNTLIGDGSSAGRNIIASNGSNGIIVAGGASTGNRINGNTIGFVGFGNTASGVAVSSATDTAIIGNSIYANGILGIDLDNNGSPGGPHAGANHLQNYPDVYAAKTIGSTTRIGGQFNGTPSTGFQLDFYYSDGCNGGPPKNYGQGQNYIGSTTIGTDVFGNTAFGFTTTSLVPGNKYITATATRMIGLVPDETSEFSKCIVLNAPKPALTNGATWFLKDYLITGAADKTFGYGFPATPLLCAWDPNQPGVKLPVIFSGGTWYMRASYTTGTADLNFSFGPSNGRPVCGDWNAEGVDTIGVVSPDNTWYLRNINGAGSPDITPFQYGPLGSIPVVGDWDGNGTTTVGLVDSNNNWYLRNTNSGGPADLSFNFGFTPGYPVAGDWDGNGTTTVGSVSSGGTWAIRNSNSAGGPDGTFQYGFPGTTPLVW